MSMNIFCPANHLVLDAPRCEKCGWERPVPGEVGQAVWEPLDLGSGLGGPGAEVFARPGVAAGMAVFPSRDGVLYGVELESGGLRWKQPLEPGRMTRHLIADGEVLLAAISDERPLDQAEGAMLAEIDPLAGKIQPLWQVESHQLAPPLLAGENILLRTSVPELVSLPRKNPPQVNWHRSLYGWWSQPLHLAGKVVLFADGHPMQGQTVLRAFSLTGGRPLWNYPTRGMLSRSPASAGGVAAFLNGRTRLTVLAVEDVELLWEQEYKRIYSPPVMTGDRVFLCVRGKAPLGEAGHYLIHCLEAETGAVVGEFPLPPAARARLLAIHEGVLYLGADDGLIYALRAGDGELLWTFPLGSEEDPVRTELVFSGGKLLAGTYFGKAGAVWVATPKTLDRPEIHLDRGEFEAAAAAFALAGDLRRSAEVYAQETGDVGKALALYEHAGLYHEAGDLAKAAGMVERVLVDYEKAGDLKAVAEQLLDAGDKLGAARIFEQCGDLMRAAKYYEEGGDPRRALDVYWRLKNVGKVLKLLVQVTPEEKDIHALEQAGRFLEAGEAALRIHMLKKAAQLFKQAEAPARELAALQQLVSESPEPWSQRRLAEVARSRGDFHQEAQAWENLRQLEAAALAYHRAAQQAERVTPDDAGRIAGFYEQARNLYDGLGQEKECQECQAKIIEYRKLPWVSVEGQTHKAFREGEFNLLELDIRNVGCGVAHMVRIQTGTGRFELEESTLHTLIRHLPPRAAKQQSIALRPFADQIGAAVPLELVWTWKDHQDNVYEERSLTYVRVKAQGDTTAGGTPQQIHYHGPVYQGETVEVVGGDKIGGDRIEGDKVAAGAQKGDRVEIHRGEGVRLHGEGLGEAAARRGPECPNCHLPVVEGQRFCEACGHDLTANEC